MSKEIDPKDLINGSLGDAFVLDVRAVEHYGLGAIKGSVNCPLDAETGEFVDPSIVDKLPRTCPVVVVCYQGYLSQIACEILEEQGIDARSLTGGYRGYQMALLA